MRKRPAFEKIGSEVIGVMGWCGVGWAWPCGCVYICLNKKRYCKRVVYPAGRYLASNKRHSCRTRRIAQLRRDNPHMLLPKEDLRVLARLVTNLHRGAPLPSSVLWEAETMKQCFEKSRSPVEGVMPQRMKSQVNTRHSLDIATAEKI